MSNEKGSGLFYGAAAIAVVALLFCIYYVIPGIYHVPVPVYAEPTQVHVKYIAVFGGIAVLSGIGALFARLRGGMKSSQNGRIGQEKEEQSAVMRDR
jgi:hypothetical protein